MNHNLMYAPNKFFDLVAGNVRTVDNDTVEIDHELIIKELPLDTMNDDIISVDAFNRLYKLPIESLPSNNVFDQELNTYNETQFERMCIKENFLDSTVDSDICIFSPSIASLTFDTSASLYPSFSITDRSALNGDGLSFCWGYYRDKDSGQARSSETQWMSMGRSHNSQNLLISGSSTPQLLGELVTDELQIMDISVNEVIIQRPLKLNSIPFQTVLIAQNILTINNLNVIEKSNAVIDTFGNYTSSGFMTVETPILAPELISDWVLIKENNNLIKQVSLDSLYGQPLNSEANVGFNSINLGSTSATDTRSQLKVSGIAGPLLPVYPGNENLGGRIEIYNNTNTLPLLSISAYNQIDQALSLGCYASTDTPWKKSALTFFKYQKIDDVFGLYTNTNSGAIGTAATDKLIVKYTNINLNTLVEYHQPVEFHQPVFLLNTTVDPENVETYFLTQNKSSSEVLKRDYQPAYGSISGMANVLETVINTIDVFVPLIGFVASNDPLRNITNNVNSMEILYSGLYEINYNVSIQPAALASTKLWDVAVFVNGTQTINSSIMCCQTTDAQELTEISNSCFYDGTASDVFDLRITNRTNSTNVIMRCATMTIKRLLN